MKAAVSGTHRTAYVHVRSGTSWAVQAFLEQPGGFPGVYDSDTAVMISGDTAIVGDQYEGAVYVFVRSGSSWSQQASLAASDGAIGGSFGRSIAIDADTVLISAHGDDVGEISNAGSAYVFVRSGTSWTQQAKLTAAAPDAWAHMGSSVALSGDTAVVGIWKKASAFVFVRSGSSWTQQATLTSDTGGDHFGDTIAISGDTVLIGAHRHNSDNEDPLAGAAFVFKRTGSTWNLQEKITLPGARGGERFGSSVAIGTDTLVIGADGSNAGGNAVYLYPHTP